MNGESECGEGKDTLRVERMARKPGMTLALNKLNCLCLFNCEPFFFKHVKGVNLVICFVSLDDLSGEISFCGHPQAGKYLQRGISMV